jgi:hypothetical protein
VAYATGSATDPNDLLQKLATFIVAAGWTQDRNGSDSPGWRAVFHKSGQYVHLRSTVGNDNPFSSFWSYAHNPAAGDGGLHLFMSTVYSGSDPYYDTPQFTGSPLITGTSPAFPAPRGAALVSGAITAYHFFADSSGDNILAMIEVTPGFFSYIVFGISVDKIGSWTGGAYYGGAIQTYYHSYPFLSVDQAYGHNINPSCPFSNGLGGPDTGAFSGYVRCDVDTFTWVSIGTSLSGGSISPGYTGKQGQSAVGLGQSSQPFAAPLLNIPNVEGLKEHTVSSFNGMVNLLPIRLYVKRATGGFSPFATIPNIFSCFAVEQGGYVPGTVYSLGSDDYMIFPRFAIRKVA